MTIGLFMQDIGGRVRSLRTGMQISQRDLAKKCGLSQPTIANIERGRTTELKGYVLEALARELNTTQGFILNGPDSIDDHESVMMETEINAIFKSLSMEERETVLKVLRAMHRTDVKLRKSDVSKEKEPTITRY